MLEPLELDDELLELEEALLDEEEEELLLLEDELLDELLAEFAGGSLPQATRLATKAAK